MSSPRARHICTVVSLVGSILAVVFGYVNVTALFLIDGSFWEYVAFVVATALLAIVGALPGMVLRLLLSSRAAPVDNTARAPE